jgi:RNA polymerase sigma factor (sigma-70 family)
MLRRAFGSAFSADEIEDIYSSAWLGTLRALARRQQNLADEEIRKYVLTAVAHQASKELRRRRRRPTAPLDDAPEVLDPIAPSPEEYAAASEDRGLARELLVTLPPRRRAVMMLRYGWGLEPRQVCNLVKGLSPRAYRKEITRGVDELTQRMRLVEQGEWCANREPLLKTYVSGLADDEETRQARHHLSNCRNCSDFVARLKGHLHELGGTALLPLLAGGVGVHSRLPAVVDRLRTAGADNGGDSLSAVSTQGASARGSGTAGAGLLAKLAGLGAGGKLAAACLAGGAAAVTCAAVGIGPIAVPDAATSKDVAASHSERRHSKPAVPSSPVRLVSPVAQVPDATGGGGEAAPVTTAAAKPAQPSQAADSTPVVATATPAESEFGTAAAAQPASGSNSTGKGSSPESSAVGSEFGP